MESYTIDHQILLELISKLPQETLEGWKCLLLSNMDCYMRLVELMQAVSNMDDGDTTFAADSWRTYLKAGGGSRFSVLAERYIQRYQEWSKSVAKKGSIMELATAVSNHSKWHRMLQDRGRGNQYREDMRRFCFLCRLSYLEALEFLWSAGQPFDNEDRRDYILAICLAKKIYNEEDVDQQLHLHKLRPLFHD